MVAVSIDMLTPDVLSTHKRIIVSKPLALNARKYLLLAAVITLLVFSSNASSETQWDVEYLPSDEYEQAFGIGVYQSKTDGFGFYGNLQVTLSDREPKYDSLNVSSYGDPVTERYKDITIFNVGITKRLSSNLNTYAGVGYAVSRAVAKKNDPFNILGSDGDYYVDDPANDESGGNLNAGILLGVGKVVFNFGYHSFTSSPYIGVGGSF